jgi:HAE1 family hydrophobic/amphiphilic exporter-1
VQAAITVASKTLPQSMTAPPNYKKVNPADSPSSCWRRIPIRCR